MRNFILLGLMLVALSSCQITVVEPVYDPRNQVTGSFVMDEYSETYDDYYTYSISITKSSNSGYQVYLDNFYDAKISVNASVDNNRITIPYQVVNGYEIEGVGNVSGSAIYFSYRVKDLYNHTPANFCKTTAQRAY